MGQSLFEPPDVNGWALGPGWFSTGAMLARMNFSSTLAANQRFNLARAAAPFRKAPEDLADRKHPDGSPLNGSYRLRREGRGIRVLCHLMLATRRGSHCEECRAP